MIKQKKTFSSVLEAEKYLEDTYDNKVVSVEYFNGKTMETFCGRVDSISIDAATKNPAVVIIIFPGKRIEIEKDEFFESVKLLN